MGALREQIGDLPTLERMQRGLAQLERELVEAQYVRRAERREQLRDALRRLGEVGSPRGILDRAGQELGASSSFDRVLVSEVADGRLIPRTLWERGGDLVQALAELRAVAIELDYPLVEREVVVGRRAEIVDVERAGSRTPARLAAVLGWRSYVVAAVVVEGQTIGLMHADVELSDRALDEFDRELAALYGEGLGSIYERAVLREMLQRHRAELRSAIQWMGDRLSRLAADEWSSSAAERPSREDPAVDALTPRERQVLALMARGQTNAAIAQALVVREGTVKYHVKNVLRKLGARSRADAVARYARTG